MFSYSTSTPHIFVVKVVGFLIVGHMSSIFINALTTITLLRWTKSTL